MLNHVQQMKLYFMGVKSNVNPVNIKYADIQSFDNRYGYENAA